jgi:SAM-dependent methyltransferase
VSTRERRTVFGEVAAEYERTRPAYPDGLFDIVMQFGALARGDRALEIGAGTGKATRGFLARGLAVTALEPSAPMAELLRVSDVEVIETTFEEWPLEPHAFRLCYAAQSWHWVQDPDRATRVARTLGAGGTIALFWNLPQPLTGQVGDDIAAVYADIAPDIDPITVQWPLDETVGELERSGWFDDITKRSVEWQRRYDAEEYAALLGTHSNHRLLPDEQLARLQAAARAAIERNGNRLDIDYRTDVYLARRSVDPVDSVGE